MKNRSLLLKALGKKVHQLRKDLGLSQEALGQRSALHRTYIAEVEGGKRNPSYISLERLAAGLGVEIADLVVRKEITSESISARNDA